MPETTVYDVARLAGVSIATVSRAFTSPDKLREDTKKKVYAAATALDYHPSAIARAMAKQSTDKIAFIICKKGATILDEFYARICESVMNTVNRSPFQLIISTAEDWKKRPQSKQIEGVILAGRADPAFITDFQRRGVAVVQVNNRTEGFDLPCVIADEADGVHQVISMLKSKGHTRIGMLAGQFSPYIVRSRYNAFLSAMEQSGLEVDKENIVMCDRDLESAIAGATTLLNKPNPPTAIFAINDILAAGVMKEASRMNIRVPEELAVVGFDNSSACALTEPELTSVHVDCSRMGEACTELLLELIEHHTDVPRVTTIPVTLVERKSSG